MLIYGVVCFSPSGYRASRLLELGTALGRVYICRLYRILNCNKFVECSIAKVRLTKVFGEKTLVIHHILLSAPLFS